jgi:hypothetical protein
MMTDAERAIVRQAAEILGRQKSDARAAASRANGKKGGRPKTLLDGVVMRREAEDMRDEQPYPDEALEGGRR